MGHASADGFGDFFVRYTRTWYHAVATAALTAFGTLTVVDRRFAAVALLAYALPPVALYLRGGLPAGTKAEADGAAAGTDSRDDRSEETDDAPREAVSGQQVAPDADLATASADVPDVVSASADAPDDAAVDVTGDARDDGAADGTCGGDPDPTLASPDWGAPPVPTDADLHAAAVASGAVYAAGDEGVVVGGDDCETVLPGGPAGDGQALRGLAAVPGALWVAGDGGALGRLDPVTGRHADHSAPAGDTNSLTDVAAATDEDGETVLVADGSGALRRGRHRDGEVTWADPVTPGSGASVAAVTLDAEGVGYAVDTDDGVFRTRDGGRSFERLDLDAAGTAVDVAATPTGCLVLDDDGRLHHHDGGWTHERVPDATPWAVAAAGDRVLVAGEGGVVHERTDPRDDWTRHETPVAASLAAAALGSERAVAAGPGGSVATRGQSG
jgi:hypothetical protein